MSTKLVFINSSNPDEEKTVAKRKAVRAHAARDKTQDASQQRGPHKRKRYKKLYTFQLHVGNVQNLTVNGTSKVKSEPETTVSSISPEDSPPEAVPAPVSQATREPIEEIPTDTNKEGSNSQGSLTKICCNPGAGWAFPFVLTSDSSKSYVPNLLNHYLSHMAVDIPELDYPGSRGSLRSKWFPMVITEASTLNVIVLIAGSHYAAQTSVQRSPEILCRLRHDALRAIQQSIKSCNGDLVSDQVIGAVAKMASYEAMFGTEESYHVHMKGLMRMVNLRGGIETLGLDGLLARMLLWIDINAAFLLGTSLYFQHAKMRPGYSIGSPNPAHFLGAR
ncbi:MAG: hypothetical protein LQ351_003599 [Letrouitia transgressa]|nr:MAG: hypothetical protein LQ351_003599 [Letrouitia transgressa]